MKKIILSSLFLISGLSAISQQFFPPNVLWAKCYGGSANDKANSVKYTVDGGFIIVGATLSNDSDVTANAGGYDIWVLKIDSTGSIIWQKTYGGSNSDIGNDVIPTSDGGYLVGASSGSSDGLFTSNIGLTDVVLLKLDASGNLQWMHNYGGTNKDNLISVGQLFNGHYIIGATTYSNDVNVSYNHGSSDFWVFEVDSLGSIVWEKSYGGSGSDFCGGVQQIAGGYLFIAGSTMSTDGDIVNNHGNSDFFCAKMYDKDSVIWKNCFGGTEDEILYGFQQNATLGYVLCGNTLSNDGDVSGHVGPFGASGTTDAWVMKLTDLGNLQWQDSYGGGQFETATDVFQQVDNDYVICGWSNSMLPNTAPNHGGFDNWILKMAKNGNRKWSLSLGGSDDELSNGVAQTPDSGYVMAGSTRSNDIDVTANNGQEDLWVVRLGKQIPNAVNELYGRPSGNIYPNPASDIATLHIDAHVFPIADVVKVIDVNGNEVHTYPTMGMSSVAISTKQLASGIYAYIVYSGSKALGTGKFIVK